MDKIRGFLEYERSKPDYEQVQSRVRHFHEFEKTLIDTEATGQAARCMDCGVPFCHSEMGCPVDNLIPTFNDLVFQGHWRDALECLHSTNNFPEFTGRLCPAPCETACVLGIGDLPVNIKMLERAIIDHGFEEGWVEPRPAKILSGKKVAVVGSGPAGLSCAQQLARMGHIPTVFEREDRIGGLLRYGIPDFKMEKWHIDQRIEQMRQEGVIFKTSIHVGRDISTESLLKEFDSLVLAIGAEEPIPLNIQGENLKGVHYAMEYLIQANRRVAGESIKNPIHAEGKDVIIIGGGDTGSDCIGTANRQKAKSIINIGRSPRPPEQRSPHQPWPLYPDIFYTSTSHEEGVERCFAIRPLEILGKKHKNNNVEHLKVARVEKKGDRFEDISASESLSWKADLIFIATGYSGPIRKGLLEELESKGLEIDSHGNIKASFGVLNGSFRTSLDRVYTCGDSRRGQSLIVWAISEGRKCAEQIHADFS